MEELIRSRITLAAPYSWEEELDSDEDVPVGRSYASASSSVGTAARSEGTGFVLLRNSMQSTSPECQTILRSLLRDKPSPHASAVAAAVTGANNSNSPFATPSNKQEEENKALPVWRKCDTILTTRNCKDGHDLVRLVQQDKVSLFASLLRLFDAAGPATPLSSSSLVHSWCALLPRSQHIPAHRDAREMILCALAFLSSSPPESLVNLSTSTTQSEFGAKLVEQCFPLNLLPFIKVYAAPPVSTTNAIADNETNAEATVAPVESLPSTPVNEPLDRRSYVKCGKWSMTNKGTSRKVVLLEQAFLSSTATKHLARIRQCPRLQDDKAEWNLLQKGVLPTAPSSPPTGAKKSPPIKKPATSPAEESFSSKSKKQKVSA
eukprot:scaffold574294_cov71-Attheya_sp.AAC.1